MARPPPSPLSFLAEQLIAQGIDEARQEGLKILSGLQDALVRQDEDLFIQKLREAPRSSFWDIDEELGDDPDDDGETLSMLAADKGLGRALGALLEAGAKPDFIIAQLTPMRAAAASGRLGCVKLLLEAGANPNGVPEQTVSPLSAASFAGAVDCCLLLLEAGADPAQVDWRGQTPVQSARAWGAPAACHAADAIEAWVEARELARALRPELPGGGPKAL